MNQYRSNSVDEIFSSSDTNDVWDDLYNSSEVPKFLFPRSSTKLRMIGKTLGCKRIYIPSDNSFIDNVTSEEIMGITNQDRAIYEKCVSRIYSKLTPQLRDFVQSTKTYHTDKLKASIPFGKNDEKLINVVSVINNIFNGYKWYDCFLTNVLVREDESSSFNSYLSIWTVNKTNGEQINSAFINQTYKKISGLFAFDLILSFPQNQSPSLSPSRSATRSTPSFTISIGKEPEHLTIGETENLLKYGIFDLKKSIKYANKKTAYSKKGFLYKPFSCYKSKDEIAQEIFTEYGDLIEAEHNDKISEGVNDVPEDFFSPKETNSITGLEL